MNLEIIMVTSDRSNWILPISFYFFDKYLPKKYKIHLLGFNKNLDFILPDYCTFHSMGTNQDLAKWSNDIYNVTKSLSCKYIMFLLDDFFLMDHLREDKLNFIINMMDENNKIGLCNIGYAPQYDPKTDDILINNDDFFLFEQHSKYYQINCQPSVYRLSHFNKYFQHPNNPWNLELNKSHENIKERLICSSPLDKADNILFPNKNHETIYHTQLKSALSKTFDDKINLTGIKDEDLIFLINNNMIDKNKILFF
jgi:hypothetical protein